MRSAKGAKERTALQALANNSSLATSDWRLTRRRLVFGGQQQPVHWVDPCLARCRNSMLTGIPHYVCLAGL